MKRVAPAALVTLVLGFAGVGTRHVTASTRADPTGTSTIPLATAPPGPTLPQVGIITAPPTTLAPGVTAATSSTSTVPPMTTAAPVEGALFASIDDLVARWNEEAATTAAAGGPLVQLIPERFAVVVGSLTTGLDIFAAQIPDGPLVGGVLNDDGAVETVVVVVNPRGTTTSGVVVTVGDVLIPEEVWVDFMTGYTELIGAVAGETRYLVGTEFDVVLATVDDNAGNTFVQITVAPLTDESTAIANADELLRPLVETASIA